MVKVTRILSALYAASFGVVLALGVGVEVAAMVYGGITVVASALANILPDNTWPDAIVSAFAINVVPGKTLPAK